MHETSRIWLPLALALAACRGTANGDAAPSASAAPPAPPAQQAELSLGELARTWLTNDCATGDDHAQLVAQILQYAAELEPLFLVALDEGPPEALASEVDAAAQARFRAARQELERGETFGLGDEELALAKGRSLEQFAARVRAGFDLGYRSQAILGLALVGGEESRRRLQEIAADDASPLQSTARAALK